MERCKFCGNHHDTVCPTVKAIEYHPDGTIKRVEFKTASDYSMLPSQQIGKAAQIPTPLAPMPTRPDMTPSKTDLLNLRF